MKKVSKITLKSNGTILHENEMKNILGGATYRCCCGMGTNTTCFDVNASSLREALSVLSDVCERGYAGMGGCY